MLLKQLPAGRAVFEAAKNPSDFSNMLSIHFKILQSKYCAVLITTVLYFEVNTVLSNTESVFTSAENPSDFSNFLGTLSNIVLLLHRMTLVQT